LAKIELRSVKQVRAGQSFTLTLVNVGSQAFRFDHPGASNGCGAFRWTVSAANDRGQSFFDGSDRRGQMCTMAIVPPRTIVIGPGEAVDITVGRLFREGPMRDDAGSVELPAGEYSFSVMGAGLVLSTAVTITKV
jgi:hypothetical protein